MAEAGARLGGHRQSDRRAHLLGDRLGDVRDPLLVFLDDPAEQGAAVGLAGLGEAVEGAARRGDRLVDVGLAAQRYLGNDFLGRRIDDLVTAAPFAVGPFAVDIMLQIAVHGEGPCPNEWLGLHLEAKPPLVQSVMDLNSISL